jgi:deazaflavin-dependent oxidoreductase (nitroreductase family)
LAQEEELIMVEKIKDVRSPRGLARLAWRAPIWFYRLGLGGLLGGRFLLLNHIGRKTGKPRQAVLEVVQYNKETGGYVVASGFGEKSDWYLNVSANPEITIQVGKRRMTARAERLGITEATEIMLDYNRRNPKLLRSLASILGYRTDGSEADVRTLSGVIPILTFTPYGR